MKKSALLLMIGLFACGGGDSRPEGTYNYVTGSGSGSLGCTDDFMDFISVAAGDGVTDLKVTLKPEGDNSIMFEYNDAEAVLSPSDDDKKIWVGTITGSTTISGCRITETLSIGIEDLGDGKIKVDFLDEWENTPLDEDCPFAEDSCSNVISAEAKKI